MRPIFFFALLLAFVPGPTESRGVLSPESTGHADQYFRRLGFKCYLEGRHEQARAYFEYASRYADKTSQLALAVMYRDGDGVQKDLVLAYAWLDLASERGYPAFLVERERVWHRLNVAEREQAIDVATALYAEYGDRVAKKRHRYRLKSHLRKSLAAHPSLVVYVPARGLDTEGYFSADRFGDAYWSRQDALWQRSGAVTVGPLQQAAPPVTAEGAE